jgi:hypothetical protein
MDPPKKTPLQGTESRPSFHNLYLKWSSPLSPAIASPPPVFGDVIGRSGRALLLTTAAAAAEGGCFPSPRRASRGRVRAPDWASNSLIVSRTRDLGRVVTSEGLAATGGGCWEDRMGEAPTGPLNRSASAVSPTCPFLLQKIFYCRLPGTSERKKEIATALRDSLTRYLILSKVHKIKSVFFVGPAIVYIKNYFVVYETLKYYG